MNSKIDFPFQSTAVDVTIPLTYSHYHPGSDKPLLVFFHGYKDNSESFLRRAFPHLDQKYEILAPNGLFPLPVQASENIWKPAFAWYFADYARKRVLIPPEVSALAVLHLIEKLDLIERPKVLIGFSQGGFFLPHIFPKLRNIKKLFSIGASYRREDYPSSLSAPLDALHGTEDTIVHFEAAREKFKTLHDINPDGVFQEFRGLAHTMNDEARAWLHKQVQACL